MSKKNMRSVILIAGLLLVATLPLRSLAQDFEGIIYYQIPEMTNQGMNEMPYMIKGSRARMEFGKGNEKGAMILMSDQSKLVFVMDAMKGYMTMDYNKEFDKSETSSDEDATVMKTGETKTIAGKNCEVWNIKTDDNNVEACMAKGLGTFMIPQNPISRQNTPVWAREIMEGGAMPLEVLEINGDGSKTVQMRATKIEEKKLAQDLFEIPEGYKDVSSMMKMMQNQGN
ncbi:MAG: DUF4412 domain-containing protein [Balneolaceae bacterium]|jgi:hypothetical protein